MEHPITSNRCACCINTERVGHMHTCVMYYLTDMIQCNYTSVTSQIVLRVLLTLLSMLQPNLVISVACLLCAIKNWTVGRPGNETNHHPHQAHCDHSIINNRCATEIIKFGRSIDSSTSSTLSTICEVTDV